MTANSAPFGIWSSPVNSGLVTASNTRYALPTILGNRSYWVEGRPQEQGRCVVVCKHDQAADPEDLLPPPYSASSKVHEYGGGAYVPREDSLLFVNHADQKIHRRYDNENIVVFFGLERCRYADLESPTAGNLLVTVEEDHNFSPPRNRVLGISLNQVTIQFEISGADFYGSPRLSPDGKKLAWMQWQHPQMPWDGTELYVADLSSLNNPIKVAGSKDVSVFQPEWGPDGKLYYASDTTGWWSLYRFDGDGEDLVLSKPDGEFGLPQWVFGMRVFGLTSASTLVAAYTCHGQWRLTKLDIITGQCEHIDQPFTAISHLCAREDRVLLLGGNVQTPPAILEIKKSSMDTIAGNPAPDDRIKKYLSTPDSLEFTNTHGLTAHALVYPPTNPMFLGPDKGKPPILVKCHSGPTGAAESMLDYRIQYFTSRGYLVLDVNYRGSTGYGRRYRELLAGKWGIADVEDCVAAAEFLISNQTVDPTKTAISGSSAGGLTVLCALFKDVFKAGASLYGVTDLEALAVHTHKFESHYMDKLIGPYPQDKTVYKERSPFTNYEALDTPVIFFQGGLDKVVPPEQAQSMYDALKIKGVACCHMFFEQEGHGFRQATSQRTVIDGEYAFYTRVFGLTPSEPLLDIPIVNG